MADKFEDEIDLIAVIGSIWRRKFQVAFFVLIGMAVATLITVSATPLYISNAQVQLDERQKNIVGYDPVVGGTRLDNSVVQTQVNVIRSAAIIGNVIDKLDLINDPEFNPRVSVPEDEVEEENPVIVIVNTGIDTLKSLIDGAKQMLLGDDGDNTEVYIKDEMKERYGVIGAVQGRVTVRGVGGYVLQISVETESPKKSALIANAIAEEYRLDQIERKYATTRNANIWLSERIEVLREELIKKSARVEEFKRENNWIEASGQTINQSQLSDVSAQIIAARAQLAEARAQYENIQRVIASGDDIGAVEAAVRSNTIADLRRQYSQIVRRKAELEGPYGDRHPEIIKVNRELADVENQINAELERVALSVRNDLIVKVERVASLERDFAELEKRYQASAEVGVALAQLEREEAATRKMYDAFLSRFKATEETENLEEEDVRVIAAARPIYTPSSPNRALNFVMGTLFGGALGVLFALWAELRDRTFRRAAVLEEFTGLPVLSEVPLHSARRSIMGRKSLYASYKAKPHSGFAESLRSLYAALGQGHQIQDGKFLMLTSSVPEEGKSTLARCFVSQIASAGLKVAVVDADARRHDLSAMQIKDNKMGAKPISYVDYIGKDCDLSEFANKYDDGVDSFLLTEMLHNPEKTFSSADFERFCTQLKAEYDVVVFDSAPVLVVSDSSFLVSKMDFVVCVVEWGRTPRDLLASTVKLLNRFNGNVGLVLNKVDRKKMKQYGDYNAKYYGSYNQYYMD